MKFSVLALGAAVASISCATQCAAQSFNHMVPSTTPSDLPGVVAVSPNDPASPGGRTQQHLLSPSSSPALDSAVTSGGASTERRDMRKPVTVTKLGPAIDSLPDHLVAVLAQTPEVGIVPVVWPQGPQACTTPNTVAAALLEKGCTDGLWATHPAQRECQCRRIQTVIQGHHPVNRYTAGKSACTCPSCQASVGVNNFANPSSQLGLQNFGPTTAGQFNPNPMTGAPAGSPTAVQVAPVDASRLMPPGFSPEPSQGAPAIVAPALPPAVIPQMTPPPAAESVPFVAPTPEFPSDLPSLPSLPAPPAGGGMMPPPALPALPAFEIPEPDMPSPGTAGPSNPLPDVPMQSADSLVAMKAKKNLR